MTVHILQNALKDPKHKQINALVINELDTVLTEEVLNELAVEDAMAEDFCWLSLNAIAGTDTGSV